MVRMPGVIACCLLMLVSAGRAQAQPAPPVLDVISFPLSSKGGPVSVQPKFIIDQDAKWFAIGYIGETHIYSLPAAQRVKIIKTLEGHTDFATSIDGSLLALTVTDAKRPQCQTHLLKIADWSETKLLKHHADLRFGPDTTALSTRGEYFTLARGDSGGGAGRHEVIKVATGETIFARELREGRDVYPKRLQFLSGGRKLVCLSDKFEFINTEKSEVTVVKEFDKPHHCAVYSEERAVVAVAGTSGEVTFYSEKDGQVKGSFVPFAAKTKVPAPSSVSMLGFLDRGKYLVVGGALPDAAVAKPTPDKTAGIRIYDFKGRLVSETKPGGPVKLFESSHVGEYFMTFVDDIAQPENAGMRLYKVPAFK